MGNSRRIDILRRAAVANERAVRRIAQSDLFRDAGLRTRHDVVVAERGTVALLAATYIALEVQIRGEEAYLGQMHGEAYRNYCARGRRWL